MSELNDICKMLKEKDKKIYIILNKVYFNEQMEELKKIVRCIEKLDINALIFSDMAILNIVREENLNIRLVWYSKLTTKGWPCAYGAGRHAASGSDINGCRLLD